MVVNKLLEDVSSLTWLSLNDNVIDTLTGSCLRGFTSLKSLLLARNRISAVDDRAFSPLHNLTLLDVQ